VVDSDCTIPTSELFMHATRLRSDWKPLTKHSLWIILLLECLQLWKAGSVDGGVCLVAECEVGIAMHLVSTERYRSW
jgi:hypothetical protein